MKQIDDDKAEKRSSKNTIADHRDISYLAVSGGFPFMKFVA